MTLNTVRAGTDTHVRLSRPTKVYSRTSALRVQVNAEEIFVRVKSPAPRGAKINSAYLYLTQRGAATGTNTLEPRQLTSGFDAQTVGWNSKPTAVTAAASSLSKTGSGDGTVWRLDVSTIYQAIASGSTHFGISVRATTSGEVVFHSLNAESFRPYLVVDWTTPTAKPTLLKPSFASVGVPKWMQTCDFRERSGTDALVSVQVQIDPTAVFSGASLWDSGTVAADTPRLDLATTSYPGLAANATTSVRMRLSDSSGSTSPYSDPVQVTYTPKGTLSLTSPGVSPNNYVQEFTPPITWTTTGLTQTHYRVTISKASSPKRLRYDSGRVKSTANTFTLPKKVLHDGVTYTITLQVWDNVTREATGGNPTYLEVVRDFTVNYSATPADPTALTCSQPTIAPWVDVLVARATSPDSWSFMRKETVGGTYQTLDSDIVPGDIVVDSTHWTYRDYSARPGVQYTYHAKAEVNGQLSNAGPSTVFTPTAQGVWLMDPSTGKTVVLGGRDFQGTMDDQATTYSVLGAVDVVRTVMGLQGLSGDVTLSLRTREGVSWRTYEDTLYEFKAKPTATFQMIIGDLNIPVILGDLNASIPAQESRSDQVLKIVTFKFWQNGDHPFEVTF